VAQPDETRAVGAALALALRDAPLAPLAIGLVGELGAGKTTFVSGVLKALGVAGAVRSPTYTLIEPYEAAGRALYHLDLYRLAAPTEVDALGVRDLLDESAVLLIEWPEKGAGQLPAFDLTITLAYASPGSGRTIGLTATTPAGRELLRSVVRVMSKQRDLSP
jgi:tRNA threonylcarbamoyladenosine biosynthesis protein TsaE